jgi:hypothetical protein
LTWATTSGTSVSIRKADELSTTTAPAAAKAGAYCLERSPPAENRAISTPAGSAVARSSISTVPQAVSTVPPAERAEANRRNSERELPLLEDREHGASDRAGGSDDGDLLVMRPAPR